MNRAGFTLIEVLIATMILAFGLTTLMISLGNCAAMMTLSKQYQDAQYVFSLGELKYPIQESTDVEKDLPVDPDTDLVEGYTFERTVDKKTPAEEEKDKLFVVRTRVRWGGNDSSDQASEELVRYVWERKK